MEKKRTQREFQLKKKNSRDYSSLDSSGYEGKIEEFWR